MHFELDDETKILKESTRDFAENVIKPVIAEYDEKQEFPYEIVKQLAELQYLGLIFPEKYGGAEINYRGYATAIEELARVDGSVALTVAAHNSLCTNHIYSHGSEELREKYVTKLTTGEMIGAWGLTEPGSGSDAGGMRTTAVKDGDDWIINGSKVFITNASVGDICVVLAVTDKQKRKHGVTAFIVPKGENGYTPAKKENKLGMRSSDTTLISMDDVRIPDENRVGELGHGFIDTMKVLDGGRISIASLALGLAQGAFEAALQYSQEREQFGKPIGQFQAIQTFLADMATQIDAARLLVYKAAYLKDTGKDVTMASAQAKLFAAEVASWVTNKAIQIHGGYGFTKDYVVEKHYRDVKLVEIGEGTNEVQRLVISRALIKRFAQ